MDTMYLDTLERQVKNNELFENIDFPLMHQLIGHQKYKKNKHIEKKMQAKKHS